MYIFQMSTLSTRTQIKEKQFTSNDFDKTENNSILLWT